MAPAVWTLPLISAFVWLVTLTLMLAFWFNPDTPFYTLTERQTIPFVSDVGAHEMKPLFILGSWTSVILLNIASYYKHRPLPTPSGFLSEKNKIVQNTSYMSTALTASGSLGWICLTHFDRLNYPHLHRTFLTLYVGSFSVGALMECIRCFRFCMLSNWRHQLLTVTLIVRLCIGGVCASLGLGFWFAWTNTAITRDFCAVIEWTLGYTFAGHIACFASDLLPSIMGGDVGIRYTALV
ncbi:Frag1/DRAM/Sfk1 [Aspergillus unguis]